LLAAGIIMMVLRLSTPKSSTRVAERKSGENPKCPGLKGVAGNGGASHLERRII
jgi:hypothetical protein